MARLNTGTRIYGTANVDSILTVGQVTPNNANVGLANTGSLQVLGSAYISGNTTIGGQSTTEQVYVQGNSNLLTYSQNLENAAGWNKNTATVRFGPSANTYAPDGTNTVSQIINTTGGNDTGSVDQYFQRANRNTPYTFSSFVKQGTSPFAQINMYVYDGTVSNASANVNFSTGTVSVLGANLVNSTFVPVGGGWFRVSITLNSLVHSQLICRLYVRQAGIAGEFGYFWGAQLEPGITPSAYANTSSGNIVKANNNLFVMGNTFVYGANTSISNTTGSLVVHGGLGVSGNVNVSNTFSIITESAGNRPFTMQPGVSGSLGARFGVQNESIDLYTTGGYPLWFSTNGPRSAIQLGIATVSSAVNYLQIAGNTTGGSPILSAQGSDTNVGINITPKGAGSANITSTTTSTSNTSGALVVRGGLGLSGNLSMNLASSGANAIRITLGPVNFIDSSESSGSVRFAGTGYYYFGNSGGVYNDSTLFQRGLIRNDAGNNTVIFAGASPVRLQNTAASTSNTTGSLIVDGGIGVTGNTNIYNGSLRVTGFNNLNAPVITNPSPSVDLVIGRAFTTLPGVASGGSADLGFQWGSGGYRHYISTRHNSGVVEGNEFNFWLNSGGAAGTSTSPGTGNQLAVTFSANTVATSNSSGAVRVNGGVGVSGNVYSNTFITSINTSSFNNQVRLSPGPTAGIVGPRIEFGVDGTPDTYMTIGAYNGLNNFEMVNRNFRLGSTAVPNIMQANAATGVVTFANNVIVNGSLTVVGNVSSENVQSLSVSDPLIQLGIGNYTSDLRDIGFAAHYNAGTNAHTGLIRDSGTKEYYLFQGYTPELSSNNNVIISDPSFGRANLNADIVRANLVGSTISLNGLNIGSFVTSAFNQANVTIGVDTTQNTRLTVIEGTNASQNVRIDFSNTAINATDGKMSSAYNAANNAVANIGPVITTNSVATVLIANTTASTSNSTGALVVFGGLGVAGNTFLNNSLAAVTTTGAVNYLQVTGNTTGGSVVLSAKGSDTDVSMNLTSKNAGSINFIVSQGGNAPVVTIASGSAVFGDPATPFIFSPTIPGAWGSKLTLPGGATATIQTPESNSLRFGTFGGTGVGGYFGNTQFQITHTGSAVNYLQVTGNTTGGSPILSAQGSDTNVGINLIPKGNGSVNITSTTITTSNTTGALVVNGGVGIRGNTYVSGIFVGGQNNTANGEFTFVGGGGGTSVADRNTAAASNSAIVGGASNYIVSGADYSFIGGGQNHRIDASADYSTIAGGSNNNSQNIYNFIGGGTSSFAYSQYGVVCGGFNNSVQFLAVVGGGQFNNATGSYSFVGGGTRNTASGSYSAILGGNGASTRSVNFAQAMGNDPWSKVGSSQLGKYILSANTNSATANTMTTDWTYPAAATNQVALVANSAYMFSGSVVGTITNGGNTAMWTFQGGIKRGASVGSTALVGTPVINLIAQDGGANSWSIAIAANTTLGSLQISVVGDPSAIVRWVGRVDTTEVTF